MCRGNRKRYITTMVTYSHATTPLGQSERAYYLSYFIKVEHLMDDSGKFLSLTTFQTIHDLTVCPLN